MPRWTAKMAGAVCVLAVLLATLFPVRVQAEDMPPDVGAEAYVVMDAATGQVLVSQNAHLMEYPASITKIMTLALVLEQVDIENERDAPVTVSDAAVDALIPRASMIALGRGEVATLNDLLYATKIESANDASHALAEYICGSMDGFAQMMNEKARQLGLDGSHFINPSGQPDDDHFTTAYDMAEITRWALTVPGFREIFGATSYTMGATNKQPGGRTFNNANMAMVPHSSYYCDGVTGSKTGYTDQARYTLVTTAKRGDTELICVVMNCAYNEQKYTATNVLMDYCFNNFRSVSYPVESIAVSVPVYGGGAEQLGSIDVFGADEARFLLHNSLDENAVRIAYDVPEKYVMGQPFEPVVRLHLPDEHTQQQGGQLATVLLRWEGLEQIMADKTGVGAAWERMAEDSPTLAVLVIAVPLLMVALVVGRILWVRHKREQRRQQRLAMARSQQPVRIAERPAPESARTPYRRPASSTPQLRVAYRSGYIAPSRRPGRAR